MNVMELIVVTAWTGEHQVEVQVKHRCAATGDQGRGKYMVMSGVE